MIIENLDENIDTIFISDVHIEHENDETYRELIELLEEFLKYKGIKRIFLLGDIFDFCTGIHSFFKKRYVKLQNIIERLHKENNIYFYYIEGNHEFYMEDIGWRGVSFSRGDPFYNVEEKDFSIMITHGDVLTPSLVYRVYNFMVRSKLVKYLSYLIKISWLNYFAVWYSSKTRSLHEGNNIKKEALIDKVNKYMKDKKADLLVFGHFHRYVCFSKNNELELISKWNNLDNLKYGFIGLSSWEKPYFVGMDSRNKQVCFYVKEENTWIKKDEKYL